MTFDSREFNERNTDKEHFFVWETEEMTVTDIQSDYPTAEYSYLNKLENNTEMCNLVYLIT